MAYPDALVQVTWHFDLNGAEAGSDISEFSIWFSNSTDTPPASWDDALQAVADAAYAGWVAQFQDASWGNFLSLGYTQARNMIAVAQPGGGVKLQTEHEQRGTGSPTWVGTVSTGGLPWQLTQVVGLYTYTPGQFIPNARRRRGRIYLPPMPATHLSGSPSGAMSVNDATAWMNATNGLIKAIVAAPLPGGGVFDLPGVLSRVDQHLYGLTDLTTDTVLDTQRRRTNKLERTRIKRQYG